MRSLRRAPATTRPRLLALAVVLALVAGLPALAGARPEPVLPLDAPDPDLAFDEAGRLWVVTTNSTSSGAPANVPRWSWAPAEGWTFAGDALPRLPVWTRPGRVWAPALERIGPAEWWLFFSSIEPRSGRQCIGVAFATAPDQAFVPREEPFVCDLPEGGSIDPSVFTNTDGKRWLLWKTDGNAIGAPTAIKSVRLTDDARPSGPVRVLLRAELPWEHGIVENPELVRVDDHYVLVYSGGRYGDASYAIGTAVCTGPLGHCRRTSTAPARSSADGQPGPGGAAVSIDAHGTPQLVLHHWDGAVGYEQGGARILAAHAVTLRDGVIRDRPERAPVGRRDDRPLHTLRPVASPSDAGDRTVRFGSAGGQHLACDFGGTGIDHPVWFVAGDWHRSDLPAPHRRSVVRYGRAGDRALCADVDGDGRDERVVHRSGRLLVDGGPPIDLVAPGVPLLADWDGDGTAEPAAYDPTSGAFTMATGAGLRTVALEAGAVPLGGDWDGDGTADPGTFRAGRFRLHLPIGRMEFPLGSPSDVPLVGRFAPGPAESVGVATPR